MSLQRISHQLWVSADPGSKMVALALQVASTLLNLLTLDVRARASCCLPSSDGTSSKRQALAEQARGVRCIGGCLCHGLRRTSAGKRVGGLRGGCASGGSPQVRHHARSRHRHRYRRGGVRGLPCALSRSLAALVAACSGLLPASPCCSTAGAGQES